MSEADAILVIEDDPVLGSALIQRLRLEGFQPRLATTGAAALREIEHYRPAAIVSDIRLPDMSGEEVYRHVVARFGTMPVFFMTAFADVAQAVRLVLDDGKTVAAVARDLDLTESAVREWVKRAQAD